MYIVPQRDGMLVLLHTRDASLQLIFNSVLLKFTEWKEVVARKPIEMKVVTLN